MEVLVVSQTSTATFSREAMIFISLYTVTWHTHTHRESYS